MFQELIQRYAADLDSVLRSTVAALPSATEFDTQVRYALGWVNAQGSPYSQPTGKRIRPLLLLLCVEACGADWHTALPAAASVELLHNFSLIHDDIQDDSPTRHGRPTVWKVWGQASAINAGDAMFSLAYSALARLTEHNIPNHVIITAWRVFNQTNFELTRGQHLDMRFERQKFVSVNEYLSMIGGKSAALIACSANLGALIATGEPSLAAEYDDFGRNLGMAFQIRDDVLGIWGDPAVTGKSAATDILARKKSLPVLYGLAGSEELIELYNHEPFGPDEVDQAVQLLNVLGARSYAEQSEAQYYDKAMAALDRAKPDEKTKVELHRLVEALFQRNR